MVNMVIVQPPLWIKIVASTLLILAAAWSIAFIAVDRNYSESIKSSEQRALNKSQIFAEYALSTIKRVDQIARESVRALEHDSAYFVSFVAAQLTTIQDIAFQISVIDKNGILLFANRDFSTVRIDLSNREHFRVHQESPDADRLFISRPLVGKTSGKWSIQFSRPIFKDNRFDGVLVVSVDPGQFGQFGQDLNLGSNGIAGIIRDTGEIMARFPVSDTHYGELLPGPRPFLIPDAPKTGVFTLVTTTDNVERIFGFTRLPAYGVTALVGESKAKALATHDTFMQLVLSVGLVLTLFTVTAAVLLFRWITEKRRQVDSMRVFASVYSNSSEAMMLVDSENVIFSVNRAFTALTGYDAGEVIGQSPRVLTSGAQDQEFWREFWQVLTTTGQWRGDVRNRRKDGTTAIDDLRIDTAHISPGSRPIRIAAFCDVTTEKASQQEIFQLANFDALTGLPNRRAFLDTFEHEITRAERSGAIVALMFLDIDHFKNINDTLGHFIGDLLLIEVSSRLRKTLRQIDTIARMGGDEFTVILSELSSAHDIEHICQKILSELTVPFRVEDHSLYVSASIGIAMYPGDCVEVESLLKSADQAMYASKQSGRNRYTFYSQTLQKETSRRMQLAIDLHLALIENQLGVYFQPIVEVSSGRVCKAEALIRWQHPTLGLLMPDEFIPYAKEVGLIRQIDQWVLGQVTTRLRAWPENVRKDFQISLNKSAIEFSSADDIIQAIETCHGLNDNIMIEITERVLTDATLGTTTNVMKLHEAGFAIALDDFGTGYSSLSHLARYPISYLKIDQIFVSKLLRSKSETKEAALCESMVLLAHKLDIKVFAEGVETQEQSDWLASIGCDYVQGYLYYRPMTADEFERIVFSPNAI